MIVSVTLNPCVDHSLFVPHFVVHDTNRITHVERDAGGKGVNLSRVVAELGGKTLATGFLGGQTGLFVRAVLAQQGVQNSFLEVPGETRTNFSIEDSSSQPPTTLNMRGPEIRPEDLDRLVAWVEELCLRAGWVTMGGSLPPGIDPGIYARLTAVARATGNRVLIDADGEAAKLGLDARPDMVKPNAAEASRLLQTDVKTDVEAVEAVQHLLARLAPGGYALISRGKSGAVLACADGVFLGRSPEVPVRSTVGCGDSLLGAMLWALDEGRPVEKAFALGLAAGAATAMSDGASIGRRDAIWDLLPGAEVLRV